MTKLVVVVLCVFLCSQVQGYFDNDDQGIESDLGQNGGENIGFDNDMYMQNNNENEMFNDNNVFEMGDNFNRGHGHHGHGHHGHGHGSYDCKWKGCPRGFQCQNHQCVPVSNPQPCGRPCPYGTQCMNGRCVPNNGNNPCAAAICPFDTKCVPTPKQCITTPCPQYACIPTHPESDCRRSGCPRGQVCKHTPKQCITTPCPQYTCSASYPPPSGECPILPPGTAGICIEACDNCKPNQKCCSNGCGHVCMDVGGNTGTHPCAAVMCPVGSHCVASPKQCITTPCNQYDCVPNKETDCRTTSCPRGLACVYSPKQCFAPPCPQYECKAPQQESDCRTSGCPRGLICKHTPKQCITTPCPQYTCSAGYPPSGGQCPVVPPGTMGPCIEACNNCKPNQKCCSNGCGHVCKDVY